MKQLFGMILLAIALVVSVAAHAKETSHPAGTEAMAGKAVGQAYFDIRTGHKYVKTDNASYMEFCRKGRFLKTVSNTMPLLLKGKSIHSINDGSYILYKKFAQGRMHFKALPASSAHPEGWKTHDLLQAFNRRYAQRSP